jgi:hypothetical protein
LHLSSNYNHLQMYWYVVIPHLRPVPFNIAKN